MDGKDVIISGIIAGAEKAAANILSDANAEKDKTLENVRNIAEEKKRARLIKAEAEAQDLIERRMTLCALEERKTVLAAKQKVVDSIYYHTVSKILNMTDHIYRDFIGDMIAKYAEDGDIIVVAARDQKRLHRVWVEELAAKTKKHLSLSEETHMGRGGVILMGRNYDKNLTFEALIGQLRSQTEGAVVKKMFRAEE